MSWGTCTLLSTANKELGKEELSTQYTDCTVKMCFHPGTGALPEHFQPPPAGKGEQAPAYTLWQGSYSDIRENSSEIQRH